MSFQKLAVKLYLTNLALLTTHEIDSAYWHEWNLFNLPGEIDLFLVLNFIVLFVFIFGFEKVATWSKGAFTFSLLLSLSGVFAFVIHSCFILSGHSEFNTVMSLTILILLFSVSIIQIVVLIVLNRNNVT